MADEDDAKKQEQQKEDTKPEAGDNKPSGGRLQWIIIAVVVIACAGSGFALGRLLGAPAKTEPPKGRQTQSDDLTADASDLTGGQSKESWYYDLAPVVANLDAPGVTRYIRLTLTLQMNPEIDVKKGSAFIEEKKPILTNWLTIYLAGLSLEDIRGDRNLKRIQSQIVDAFNEKLFPDAKPQIKTVLFKEFAIQ